MTEQNRVYMNLVNSPDKADAIMNCALRNGAGYIQHGAVFLDVTGEKVKCNISPDGEIWLTKQDGKYFSGRLTPVKFLFFDECPSGVKLPTSIQTAH